MNENVSRMREAISAYHKKALETQAKIAKMRAELLPDVAQERIKAAQLELESLKTVTVDKITAAAKAGRSAAEEWGKIKPDDIDPKDSALLQSGLIKLKQSEYDDLCKKHQNNGTMSRILSDYADRHNQAAQGKIENMIFTPCLATVKKKTDVWDKLEQNAQSIVANISSNRGFASGADDPFVISSVETFGQNTEI